MSEHIEVIAYQTAGARDQHGRWVPGPWYASAVPERWDGKLRPGTYRGTLIVHREPDTPEEQSR